MSDLDAALRTKLEEAIRSAFSVDEFARLLTTIAQEKEMLTGKGDRPGIINEVIGAALREGWLETLIGKAAAARPERADVGAAIASAIEDLQQNRFNQLTTALIELLKKHGLEEALMFRAYHRLAPNADAFVIKPPLLDAATRLVNLLGQATYRDRRFPLLEFAGFLRKLHPDPALHAPITAWMERAVAELRLPSALLAQVDANVEQAIARDRQRSVALLVSVWPKDEVTDPNVAERTRSEYFVSAWWKFIGADGGAADGGEIGRLVPCDPADLPELVHRFVSDLEPQLEQAGGRLLIELFLPLALMTQAADQWEALDPVTMRRVKLAHDHTVVIRSWDRMYLSALARARRKWRERWQKRRGVHPACTVDRCQFEEGTFAGYAAANDSARWILSFVPSQADFSRPGAILDVLANGIPIGLWRRTDDAAHTAAMTELLRELSAGNNDDDWREQVRQVRLQAVAAADDHLGRHLTLLWDDPERLPPDDPSGTQLRSR